MKCETCKYWKTDHSGDGFCRRYAPKPPTPHADDLLANFRASWPRTWCDCECGEWAAKDCATPCVETDLRECEKKIGKKIGEEMRLAESPLPLEIPFVNDREKKIWHTAYAAGLKWALGAIKAEPQSCATPCSCGHEMDLSGVRNKIEQTAGRRILA